MKSVQTLILVATFGLLLSGCAATAFIEKDDAVNFNRYKTYAWLDENDDSSGIQKNSLQESNLRQAVNAELAKANWKEEKTKPDIILKHDILVEKTVKENTNPVYSQGFTRRFYNPYTRRFSYIYYPSQFAGYRNEQYESREGTLTISMIDATTDKVVWQGWTTDEVSSKNLTSKEIQGSVKNIFRKFDPVKN
ncbi:MAG: DUF4136 domain-containing protein [Ferruginibacter sp.]|nr:DUF4136 domain-containing protein [Ferruginibacter sp.]